MTSIDDYLAALTPEARKSLAKLRDDIRKAAPDATEGKSYGLELQGYELSKGTIRFAPGKTLPAALVKKLVKARLAEKAAKARPRSNRKQKG